MHPACPKDIGESNSDLLMQRYYFQCENVICNIFILGHTLIININSYFCMIKTLPYELFRKEYKSQ